MYTTDEKVKDFADVPDGTSSTQLKQYIRIVSGYMDKAVGYRIGFCKDDTERTLTFDGSGTDVIDLGKNWVSAFGEVQENGAVITDSVLGYPINEPHTYQLVMKIGNFCEDLGAITLADCKVGAYIVDWKEAEHNLPEELEHACNVLVHSIIRTKANGGMQVAGKVASEKTSQYSITFASGVVGEMGPDEVSAMQTLAFYKDHFIA